MSKYSRMNKEYKYIFTNVDIFQKGLMLIQLNLKRYKTLNLAFKKYS